MHHILNQVKFSRQVNLNKKTSKNFLKPSILFFLEFLIKLKNFSNGIKKGVLYLMFIQTGKYSVFNILKIISAFEIKKSKEINFNLTYVKFKNIFFEKRNNPKKCIFNHRSFYSFVQFFFKRKYNSLSFQFNPVLIINLVNSDSLLILNFPILFFNEWFSSSLFIKKKSIISVVKNELTVKKELLKKKISMKKFYNFYLPEYLQSQGSFDSTGRRINSFAMIVDQTLYIFKKVNSFILNLKKNFQIFFKEIHSLVNDFQGGKNDVCKFCVLKHQKNNFISGLKNFCFLKLKIFQKINKWTRKYSSKIRIKLCCGHMLTPSDQSVEKIIFNLKKNSINKLQFNCYPYHTTNLLKRSFENLNLFQTSFRTRLLHFAKKKIVTLNFLIFKKYDTVDFQNTLIEIKCVFDLIFYKESFLKLDFKLYEYCLFIFIWNFFGNLNFISITLDLFYNVFQKRLSTYLTYYIQIIKKFIMFGGQQAFNNRSLWKLKNYLRKRKLNLHYFISIDMLKSEFNKISASNGKTKNLKFGWYFSLKTSLNQKIKWNEIKVLIDLSYLIKECLAEKFKILFKTIQNKKNLKIYKICSVKISEHTSLKKNCSLTLSIINLKDNFKFKKIKINCDLKNSSSLLMFICAKFKISFILFLSNCKTSGNLLIYIKNQFSKVSDSSGFPLNNQYFHNYPKNIFESLKCIMIQNCENKLQFSKNLRPSVEKQISIIFIINQLILRGPVVYLWLLKKTSTNKENWGLKSEFFFVKKLHEIIVFSIKEFYSNSLDPLTSLFFKTSAPPIGNFSCNMGPQKISYIFKKNFLFEKIEKKCLGHNYEVKFLNNFAFSINSNNKTLKKLVFCLSTVRVLNFKLYKILKTIFFHISKFKWHYQLVFNVIKLQTTLKNFHSSIDYPRVSKIRPNININNFYLIEAFEILIGNIKKYFLPKVFYYKLEKKVKPALKKSSMCVFKSWRENFVESNLNGTLKILENFKKPGPNMIIGILNTGCSFLIEKNFIFNYRHRFEHLIFKKLNSVPAKIVSVYPKISQVKFSSLIDDKRFLLIERKFDKNFFKAVSIFEPFVFLEGKLDISYCNIRNVTNFVKNKKLKDCFVRILNRDTFTLSFIVDEMRKNFFSFHIHVFFDKETSNYIYQWKNKLFFGQNNFYKNFLKLFENSFRVLINHVDFLGCGSNKLENFVNNMRHEKKKIFRFFFTFVDDEFLVFRFICKDIIGIQIKGNFRWFSGIYLFNNYKFVNLESLKNWIFKKMDKI